jgi:hypothetical protein
VCAEHGLTPGGPSAVGGGAVGSWLRLDQVFARQQLLDSPSRRHPESAATGAEARVHWPATETVPLAMTLWYLPVPRAAAVDVTLEVEAMHELEAAEFLVASSFSPYHVPHFAIRDTRLQPQNVHWCRKWWRAMGDDDLWPRSRDALAVLGDGRWQDGINCNWRVGPDYSLPATLQVAGSGPAILQMAHREDCMAISGVYGRVNVQHFHLHGKRIRAREQLAFTIRLVLIEETADICNAAERIYREWTS